MFAEAAWVLVSSGTQVQPQVILNPNYLPDYLSVSYDSVRNDNLYIYYIIKSVNLLEVKY